MVLICLAGVYSTAILKNQKSTRAGIAKADSKVSHFRLTLPINDILHALRITITYPHLVRALHLVRVCDNDFIFLGTPPPAFR